ncbi:hypothetical protein KQI42_00210 [Tissierella sp. MSJ-40]|uniref:Uncharacterized protein n=1 Tax=Tissierella simiarum TaxID=2841534 RepID=A0ABS6E0I9_9FIRM|nr:hypothetical protein [Tissierella simiarum]MBU5436411.1 hypothetical protein [Tissierella simiarum]
MPQWVQSLSFAQCNEPYEQNFGGTTHKETSRYSGSESERKAYGNLIGVIFDPGTREQRFD